MIEQAELNRAFLQDMASRAEPSFLEGMASRAEPSFFSQKLEPKPSRAEPSFDSDPTLVKTYWILQSNYEIPSRHHAIT